MNGKISSTLVLAGVVSALVLNACGEKDGPASGPSTSIIASAARNMEQRDGDRDDRDHGDDRDESEDGYRTRFMQVFDALRAAPVLAPLFDMYQVPSPVEYDDDAAALISLLRAVRISLSGGVVTITNRETGGVIFTGRLDALADGTFSPDQLPGGTGTPPPPPQACVYDYSAWSACQPDGTQTRTVLASSPAGCTGTPVTSQSCTYVPPVTACTSFSYSAWGACQPDGTQTRTVTGSSPTGCTGGSPVTSQSCTYVPPVTTCTSFSYSAWGACQPDGTQIRTVTGSSPSGCTGGSPVTSQSCTYVPPACAYTYSAWSACSSSGTQTRTVVSSSPAGCTGTPVLSQSCTPPTQSCGTCHAIPPATGRHAFHTSFLSCGTCHGSGYSSTTTNPATHLNGVKDVASSTGWNSTTRSCSNSCHGSRSW
jgi:hypothetical protein